MTGDLFAGYIATVQYYVQHSPRVEPNPLIFKLSRTLFFFSHPQGIRYFPKESEGASNLSAGSSYSKDIRSIDRTRRPRRPRLRRAVPELR